MKSILLTGLSISLLWCGPAFGSDDDSETEASVACEECSARKASATRLEKLPAPEKAAAASFDWGQFLGGGMNLLGAFLNYRSTQSFIGFQQNYWRSQQNYFYRPYSYSPWSSYGSQAPGIIPLNTYSAPSIIPLNTYSSPSVLPVTY